MSKSARFVVASLLLVACGGGGESSGGGGSPNQPAGPSPIKSSFDATIEGWALREFSTEENEYDTHSTPPSAVTWDATGGNPGGSLAREDVIGQSDYFESPAAFHGNLTAYNGGTLRFDVRASTIEAPFAAPLVVMEAAGGILRYQGGPAATTGYTTFTVPLGVTAPGWVVNATGLPVTDVAWNAAIAAVTGLWLRAEFSSAQDNSWLDNVVLSR